LQILSPSTPARVNSFLSAAGGVCDHLFVDRSDPGFLDYLDKQPALKQVRRICLAFPETSEKLSWGHTPTFRVRDRIFAQYEDNHHGSGRVDLWCKAPEGAQEVLTEADPNTYFRPPYVGHLGWVGVHLDGPIDWDAVSGLIEEAYRMTAPRRVLAALDEAGARR
jgi:hypothetical protein